MKFSWYLKLFILSITVFVFAGCSNTPSVPNYTLKRIPKTNTEWVHVKDLNEDGTIYEVSGAVKGKLKNGQAYYVVAPTIRKAIEHAKSKGFRYIQITAPVSLSNENGFPITKEADLLTYLLPFLDNPAGSLRLENSIEVHNSIDLPLTIFGQTSFKLQVKAIKNPLPTDIVWDMDQHSI